MSYITPVTDRTALDIATLTSKAFWNVADWERVYGNSQLINSLASIMIDENIAFDILTTPTITTIPVVEDFNTFLANIERIRVAANSVFPVGVYIPGTSTEIKDDYEAGPQGASPKYTDTNLWESTLDAIWDYYNGDTLLACPTLAADLTVLTGTNAIYIDCIDAANFDIDIQGTGNLYII
jgi:hypothetical protein